MLVEFIKMFESNYNFNIVEYSIISLKLGVKQQIIRFKKLVSIVEGISNYFPLTHPLINKLFRSNYNYVDVGHKHTILP